MMLLVNRMIYSPRFRTFFVNIFFLLFFVLNSLFHWPLTGFWNNTNQAFEDLLGTLQSSDCYSTYTISGILSSISADCNNYYGKSLMILYRFAHLSTANNLALGFMISFIFIFILGSITNYALNSQKCKLIVLLGFMLSPPLMILVERGNLDLVIFALVVLMSFGLYRENYLLTIGSLILMTLLKFYTLSLFGLIFISFNKRKYSWLNSIIFLFLFVDLIIELSKIDLTRFQIYSSSFGLKIFGLLLLKTGLHLSALFQVIVGLSIFIPIFCFTSRVLPKNSFKFSVQSNSTPSYMEYVGLACSIVFLTTFFSGVSFDWRLVFLIVAAVIELTILDPKLDTRNRNYIVGCGLGAIWCSVGFKYVSPIGDLAVFMMAAYFSLKLKTLFDRTNRISLQIG